MVDYFIKDFAKSLTQINDERYKRCYILKLKLEKFKAIEEKCSYKVNIEKDSYRFSEIVSEAYYHNNLLSKLIIDLLHYKDDKEKFKVRREEKIDFLEYWMTISKEEIYEFNKYTNDINYIHTLDKPIVQGLLILMHLSVLIKEFKVITIKFIRPIYSEEDIYIKKEKDNILGYVKNILCFKCSFIENKETGD
jgi:hypothetical protein